MSVPRSTRRPRRCFTPSATRCRSDGDAAPSFVCAGSGEAREGGASYADRIVRLGDQSPDGMREKARFVLGEMERRMTALGFGWADVTATQVYTVFDIHPFLADEIVRRGAARAGLTWHYARPPVQGLDYEMDVRGLARELVILSGFTVSPAIRPDGGRLLPPSCGRRTGGAVAIVAGS